jgi:predicted small lipoprotein YifL
MRSVRASVLLVPTLALALAGCGGGGGAYCSTLTENSDVAATVFTPVIPGMVSAEQVEERLSLLGEVEDDVPSELQEDFTAWSEYLEEVGPLLGSADSADVSGVTEAADDDVDAAGEALSDHYTGTCMD